MIKYREATRSLILLLNSTKRFECMDLDNESFIGFVCSKTGLNRKEYMELMELEE